MQYFITQNFPFYLLKLLKYLYVHFKDNGCLIILTKKMFNYCNLLTHIFIDCILFKWKLYLFLDFLKYVCILLGIDGPNNKVIWKLSNYLRYFSKKNYFFQKFWGARPPLVIKWLRHWFDHPLLYSQHRPFFNPIFIVFDILIKITYGNGQIHLGALRSFSY